MITSNCQLCNASHFETIIDLGYHPLADTFLSPSELNHEEITYPLRVLLCMECGYTTLHYIVDPITRYQKTDYSYTSSNSPIALKHFNDMARQCIETVGVGKDDMVVDIGSNVGTLLDAFRQQSGCRIMGVEPSGNISKLAAENNIPTINDFFGASAVDTILNQSQAKVITATNVFNHITDLPEFMGHIARLLTDNGQFVFETPYLLHLFNQTAFDTIYLEHVSYFGVKPFAPFFERFGLYINHLEENDYMGGSIRVFVGKKPAQSNVVVSYIEREEAMGIYQPHQYIEFMKKINTLKFSLNKSLYAIRSRGEKIMAIGAATKGNTLLNFCQLDQSIITFVADTSPLKIGKVTPGSHIPIRSEEDITPDITYAVILPWNIGNFLKEKLKHLKVKFIIPSWEQTSYDT